MNCLQTLKHHSLSYITRKEISITIKVKQHNFITIITTIESHTEMKTMRSLKTISLKKPKKLSDQLSDITFKLLRKELK